MIKTLKSIVLSAGIVRLAGLSAYAEETSTNKSIQTSLTNQVNYAQEIHKSLSRLDSTNDLVKTAFNLTDELGNVTNVYKFTISHSRKDLRIESEKPGVKLEVFIDRNADGELDSYTFSRAIGSERNYKDGSRKVIYGDEKQYITQEVNKEYQRVIKESCDLIMKRYQK